MGLGLYLALLVSHGCHENLERIASEKESSLKVLEFIANLRKQREQELKNLRFDVVSLRRILEAKAKANLK